MSKIKKINKESTSYLSFYIGDELFAIHVAYVNNIIKIPKITKIPDSPTILVGMVGLGGTALPMLDGRIALGMKPTQFTQTTCILVLDLENNGSIIPIGFSVDNVHEVFDIKKDEIQKPPKLQDLNKSSVISGIYKKSESFIMVLDTDNLLEGEGLNEINLNVDKVLEV